MTRSEYRQVVLGVKDQINTFAAWFLRDAEEAADVTQDALLRLWERRADVRPPAAKTWLYRTAHRLCVDRVRRRNGRGEVLLGMAGLARSDDSAAPQDAVDTAERRCDLARALAAISPRDRALLVLREFEGMTYEQIGEVVACPLSSVKVGLHRARRRLRETLTEVAVR
jgi:RNA polymerase sigma-70 factor (ECF subfamily)